MSFKRNLGKLTSLLISVGITLGASAILVFTSGATITGNMIPTTDSTYNVGSNTVRWLAGFFDDATIADVAVETSLTVTGATVTGDMIPTTDSLYDIGSTAKRWQQGWFDDATVANISVGTDLTLDSATTTGDIIPSSDSTDDLGASGTEFAEIHGDSGLFGGLTMGGTLAMQANNITSSGKLGVTGTRLSEIWAIDMTVTNAIAGSITGNAGTVSTITGLAPDTATTQATQPNITSLGTLTGLTMGGALAMQTNDITITGAIGRDTDNEIGWGTDDSLALVIAGTTHNITSISDGAGDNDKMVTQGYVDDAVAGAGGADVNLSNITAVAIPVDLLSDTADTDSLGSATKEWLNAYLGDAGKLYLGLGQDTSINRSGANTLTMTATSGVFASDSLNSDTLNVGTNGAVSGILTWIASDNDQVTATINTSDNLAFAGATGEYTFDNNIGTTGTIYGANASAGAILNEAVSTTNPTLVPNRAENDTGLGWASDVLHFVLGGATEGDIASDGMNLITGDSYQINNTSVLNATTLGSGVTASSLTSVGTLSSGNATAIVDSATTSAQGKAEASIASEVNTGTDTARYVSPDSLSGSNYGKKIVELQPYATDGAWAVGDGIAYFRIPVELNGWNLVDVEAYYITAGVTGTSAIDVYNLTQTADMLSTAISIDTTETDSSTASTPPVIDTGEDDVTTGDKIRIDSTTIHTTPAEGGGVILTFQLP